MLRARVLVKVTFVSVKAGKAPSVVIDRPNDISELVGEICCKGYDLLKYRLAEIVEDKENGFWFQKDDGHAYCFDESALPNGGIYGLKDRRAEDGDPMAKLTASKLVPIKCPRDFEKNITLAAAVKYRLGGNRRKVRKPEEYTLELCVVLIRERVVRKPKAAAAPATSITCNSVTDGLLTASLAGAGSTLTGSKRKAPPLPFTFQASSMSISLFAPIETMQKKAAAKTGVPPGKTIKELTYELRPFIIGGDNDDGSTGSERLLGDVMDEDFVSVFTLSRFRKDLMEMAVSKFPEEYSLEKKGIGPKSKLFVQKAWNTSSWMEVPNTEIFIRLLREQMANRSRVINGKLLVRLSFGRAKPGTEFKDLRELDDYTCQEFGSGLLFSQQEIPSSPYIRQVGAVKRDECWNKPARITDLVASLYTTNTSKLYHGFLKEHGNSFFRIISASLTIRKEASVFLPSLNNPAETPLSNEIIDAHLLAVYIRSHLNDNPAAPMPETRKFPPTNATMMVIPPTFREWKATQLHHQVSPVYNPTLPQTLAISSSSTLSNNGDGCVGDLIAITFKAEWDTDMEVSVIIDDTLSPESMMEEVMDEGCVFADFGLRIEDMDKYKAIVQKKSLGRLTFKWSRFKHLKVNRLTRLNNIDSDYMITLKL